MSDAPTRRWLTWRFLRYYDVADLRQILLGILFEAPEVDHQAVANALSGHLRVMDIAAWSSHCQLMLLLPEVGAEEAAAVAGRLLRSLASIGGTVKAGYCIRLSRPLLDIAPATMHRLLAYRWPGNVRELKNLMEYAAATVEGDTLLPWHLDEQIANQPGPEETPAESTPAKFRPIDEEVRELERRRMVEALQASGGVHVRAAELIGMPIRTFATKLKQYKISAQERRKA